MPVLSRFYGISIRMYFQKAEHNPPHIHAVYGENVAEVSLKTGDVIEGGLPPKALAMVREWISDHQDELFDVWYSHEFRIIDPLE